MTDKELWALCQKYGVEALKWKRKFAALLPEVNRRGLWKKHDFYSIYHFAKIVGGVSEGVVDKVLFLDKKLKEKPKLRAEIETQGWTKVEAAAKLPVEEEKAVEMVKTLSKSSLETYARGIDVSTKTSKPSPGGERFQPVTFKLDAETHFQLKKFQLELEKKRKEPVPLGAVLKELLKLVPEEAPKKTRKSKGSTTQRIGAEQERELEAEHQGKCAFPGCNKPATEFHHTKRYAKHHTHEGVVPLCHEHHQLAHAGLIANEHDPPEDWRLRDEMRPDAIDKKYLEHMHPT